MSEQHQPVYEPPLTRFQQDQLQIKNLLQVNQELRKDVKNAGNLLEIVKAENARLAAELAALRAEARWEPLPNGYNTGRFGNWEIQIGLDSGKLYIFNIRKNRMCWEVDLPDDVDICRLVPGQDTPTSEEA